MSRRSRSTGFDDTGRGECRLKARQVLYRAAEGGSKPIKNSTPWGVERDAFNKVGFEPVKADAVKIEIVLQGRWSLGVQEVVIE